MKSKFIKGLVMFIIGAVVPYFQVTPIDITLIVVIAVLSALNYGIKNEIESLKSKSKKWSLDIINIVSGLVLSIINSLTTGVATFVINGSVDWKLAGSMAASAFGAYIVATFSEGKK